MASAFIACGQTATPSLAHSDSGIQGPRYDAILGELRDLETKFPGMAKVIEYGKSVRGRSLAMIRIGRVDAPVAAGSKRRAVVTTGTIHGDEYLGVENRLPRWFLENQTNPGVAKFLAGGGVIYVAPILNPDGYEARRRENDRGQDLNRDFDLKRAGKQGFKQVETTGLTTALKGEVGAHSLDVQLTLDYHCCVGALIYPWGHSETEVLDAGQLAEHKRVASLALQSFPGYGAGRAVQIVGYTALGASDDYFHETFGARAFTFEGAYGRESQQFDRHTDMWGRLLADRAAPAGQAQPTQPTQPGATSAAGALTLAIVGESADQLVLGAAAGDAKGMALCRGSVVACLSSSPSIAVRFSNPHKIGDRMIFLGDAKVAVADGEQFTILAQDAAGKVTGSLGVRFDKRAR